jgi:hypothetical protein
LYPHQPLETNTLKNLLVLASGMASAVLALAVPARATLITYEDLGLAPNTNFHTAPLSSGGATFNNSYSAAFNSWEGFAYSNMGDRTTAGFQNQYSSFAGGASGGAGVFALGYVGFTLTPTLTFPAGMDTPLSLEVTNTTFAALTMRDGDTFSKKFGGASGNDPDFFKLTINGLDAGGALLRSVDFYLADFRFADNTRDYILNTWQTVDISSLGSAVRQLTFTMASSDVGQFGMNTPAFFALDNVQVVPEPGASLLLAFGMAGFAVARRRRL